MHHVRRVLVVTALTAGYVDEVQGQAIAAAPLFTNVRHAELGDRIGGLVAGDVPIWRAVAIRVAADHSRGSHDHRGTLCEGLVPPGTSCYDEQITNASSATTLVVGVRARVASWPGATLSIIPQWASSRVRLTRTGAMTGDRRDDRRTFRGPGIGLELDVPAVSAADTRIGLAFGARYVKLDAPAIQLVDAYAPLSEGFTDRSVYVGARAEW